MKDFIKKYKVSILTLSIAILIGGFLYGGIFYLIKSIKSNADEVQRKKIDREINQKKLAKMSQMQEASAELEKNEKRLKGFLNEKEEIDFIKKIEKLAEETQNKIDLKINEEIQKDKKKVKVKKEESKIKLSDYDYISLQANLSGNYENLYNFIKKLENFEYYVNIISISSNLEEDKATSATFNENPFVDENSNKQPAVEPEIKPKFLLKTQINLVAYVKK